MISLVVPLGKGSKNDNLELRFLLRSFEKNFAELGNVFIVTEELPEWCSDNVKLVYCKDILKHNKDGNIIRKVIKACELDETSDIFIRSSDDQILLKPLKLEDWKIYNIGNLVSKKYDPTNSWHRKLKNTCDILTEQGKPTINFEAHIPQPVDKKRFKEIMESYEYDKEGQGYTINSLYFNNINPDTVKCTNDKITFEKDLGLTCDEILRKLETKIFLGYNDGGFTEELKKALFKLFPKMSKFEKEDVFHEYNIPSVSKSVLDAFTAREIQNGRNVLLDTRSSIVGLLNGYYNRKKILTQDHLQSDKYIILADKILQMIEENFTIKDLTDYNKNIVPLRHG